jgi:opacity protein-like surface antigen
MRYLLHAAVCALLAVYAATSAAQGSPREGRWEFTLQPQYTDAKDLTSANGSTAHIDGAFGFGMGVAYNFNDHFSLGGDVAWSHADYQATIAPAAGNSGSAFSLSGTLETSTLRLSGTWNILASALTPFVTGGIGATYIDTNVPNGAPSTVCWWDPWWGYYCGTTVPTKSETDLSYMAGAGVRWDAQRTFFLRGFVARQWLDVGGGLGTPSFTQYRIDIGFKF